MAKVDQEERNRLFEAQKKGQDVIFSYQNAFYLLGIPLISLLTLWLIGWGFNYAENMVINAYVFGTTMWVSTILTGLTLFVDHPLIMLALSLITFIVVIYMYKRIFKASWLMSFITMVLTQGLLMIMIAIISAGISFYFQYVST